MGINASLVIAIAGVLESNVGGCLLVRSVRGADLRVERNA
jgi:hypothetical protein